MSDIIRTTKTNKNLRKFSWESKKKQQPVRRGPLLGHQQNKSRRMSRWFPLNVTHNIHGNQANNNTKINIGHTFKDTKVKLCHSKVVRPNKISLSYSQCFNVNSVHPFVRALFPTNPIPEVTLAGRLKLFYSNLAKLTQDLNILNIVQRFEILFSKTLCRENHPTLQFWIRNNQACQGGTQGNVVERSNTVCITMQKSASQQHLSCIKEGWG